MWRIELFLPVFWLAASSLILVRCSDADDYDFVEPSINASDWQSDWDQSSLIFAQVIWRGGVHTFEEKNLFKYLPDPFPERRGVLTRIRNIAGNINHSIESSLIANAALYPPMHDHEFWNVNLTWNPVPVQIDGLISVSGSFLMLYVPMCYSQTYIIGTKEFRDFGRHYADLIEYLCNKAGTSKVSVFQAFKVASTLSILSYYPEFTLPWMSEELMENAIGYYYSFLRLLAGYHSMQRLNGGYLLGMIIDEMLLHLRKHNKRKFIAWSAHDDNLVPMTSLLGEIPERWPPYAGFMSFELHRKNDKEYVQVWYWYKWDRPPTRLKVKNCTTDPCTFAEFTELGKNNPREMFWAECRGEVTPSTSSEDIASMSSAYALGWIIATTVLVVIFALMTIAWIGSRQQMKEKDERIQLIDR